MSSSASTPVPSGRPRLYLIDEHDPVRRALVDRLARADSVQVVGDGADAAQAMEAVHEGGIDIVLVEIKRADGMGLELVRQLSAAQGAPRVIVLTSYPTDWEEAAAKRAGASAYLLKDINTEELLRHILD